MEHLVLYLLRGVADGEPANSICIMVHDRDPTADLLDIKMRSAKIGMLTEVGMATVFPSADLAATCEFDERLFLKASRIAGEANRGTLVTLSATFEVADFDQAQRFILQNLTDVHRLAAFGIARPADDPSARPEPDPEVETEYEV